MHIHVLIPVLVVLFDITRANARIDKKRAISKRDVKIIHSCPSMVYCQGNLLDTIQRFRIYPDSKTFVDMVQINSETVTLQNFEAMMNSTNNNPSKNDVGNFIDANFVAKAESDDWTPPDFNKSPSFLNKIEDLDIQEFAKKLVSYWPLLGRRVKEEVRQNQSQHSLIPVPEGFIVPGGRFRELYYWDSYWIMKGLLISEMKDTVKGMLENLIYLIKIYGMIPNGSRIYYINRSQPPLFTSMIGLYMDHTENIDWLKTNIDYIETELLWWINNRVVELTVNGVSYQMAHYGPESNTPRPESYAEDVTTCAYFKTEDEQRSCYNALKTGAESGWDFSTRWIYDAQGSTKGNLTNIDIKRSIPVDLNALLCRSFKLLSEFYTKVGNEAKQIKWANYADTWLKNIETLLYNKDDGVWYDFDRTLLQQRKLFFPSNLAPLWADCYDLNKKDEYGEKAVQYISNQGVDTFLGGTPSSLEASGEQWDLPNAWPPVQEYVVLGLYKTGNKQAKLVAEKLANRWIAANLKGFTVSGAMYEKYDAIEPGAYGGGGEYSVQIGFGWSNGVALSFIDTFNSARIFKSPLSQYMYIIIFSFLTFAGKLLCF